MQEEKITLISSYFPSLTSAQLNQLQILHRLYREWNTKINLISRKDIDNLYERHILHSLSIARFFSFTAGTTIADAGTGGGLPGLPLAIFFPHVRFILIDSIQKKIRVVNDLIEKLQLSNVTTCCQRMEMIHDTFDFITARAVTDFPSFVKVTGKNISPKNHNPFPNGIIYLKGGDVGKEIEPFKTRIKIYELSTVFREEFFQTKKILYLPADSSKELWGY